ncbi:hypothetical protein ACZ87_01999 [Candidatus Erwinia dacicola]|uniref:Uncharacterized protein n=1 Tax=Candidatus Erwinia dacicola TaxID=252393 RepID=A0A328TL87_9GAMM|nr:hypothetical protein ACZ87_01999 [Candidatus Erwinia dacicola]
MTRVKAICVAEEKDQATYPGAKRGAVLAGQVHERNSDLFNKALLSLTVKAFVA